MSAFREKVVIMCQWDRACFRRSYSVPISTDTSSRLTMAEVLAALLALPPRDVDPHFQQTSYLCEIGAIHYDVIGGMTSLYTHKLAMMTSNLRVFDPRLK